MNLKSNSIKVRIVGGLGNQLFGVFFGLAISEKIKARLVVDGSFVSLGSNSTRKIAICDFDLQPLAISYTGTLIEKIPFLNRISAVRKVIGKVLREVKRSIPEEDLVESFDFKVGQAFTGYFHKWSYADYFFKVHPDFKLKLKLKSESLINMENNFQSKNPICVHVRLGDFLIHSNLYSKLPEKYYIESINHIKKSYPKSEVWIFTENQRDLIDHYPYLSKISNCVIDQQSSISDSEAFYLLSTSKFLVSCNSTFSLWAAWFVEKSNNYVIVPSSNSNPGFNGGLFDNRWDSMNIETFEFTPSTS